MADVFVSYSRRDQDFVRRLHAALVAAGREVWVDWEGIPPSAKWMDEVRSAIDAADAFVFVVSPDSAASPVCRDEAEHALAVGKRIVPLVWRDTPEHTLPEAISAHNWLTLREGDDFEAGFAKLLAALDTDLEWVKEHTRLVTRARDWEASGRERSRLLRGRDLGRAEQAVAQSDRDPRPTPLQTSYVLASHQAEQRGQRIRSAVLSGGLVVALVLAGFALLQRSEAQQNAGLADQQRQVAEEQRGEAETQRSAAEQRRVEALSRQLVAQSLASRSDMPLSLLLALEGLERDGSEEAWENLTQLLQYAPQTVARHRLDELGVPMDQPNVGFGDLAVSPDGSNLAAVVWTCDAECSTEHNALWIWDTSTWQTLRVPIPVGTQEQPWGLQPRVGFSPDGEDLAFLEPRGPAVLHPADGTIRSTATPSTQIGGISWSPDGTAIRWIEPDELGVTHHLRAWDLTSDATTDMQLQPSRALPKSTSRTAYLSPGGRWAVTSDDTFLDDGSSVARTELFDASNGRRLGAIAGGVMGFGSTDDVLFVNGGDVVRVVALPSLDPIGVPVRTVVERMDVNGDRSQLIVKEPGSTISTVDLETGDRLLATHPANEELVLLAPATRPVRYGTTFGTTFGTILTLDLDHLAGLAGPGAEMPAEAAGMAAALSGDGTRYASWATGADPVRTASVYDVASGRLVVALRPEDPAGIRTAALDEDGTALYTLHDSGRLIRTPVAPGEASTVGTFDAPKPGELVTLVVSPRAGIAAVVADRTQILGPAGSITTLPFGGAASAALMPDGRSVLIASCLDETVRIVSLIDATVTSEQAMEGDCQTVVDIDATGSRALVLSSDPIDNSARLELRDLATWERRGTLSVPGESIRTAAFEAATDDATVVSLESVVRHWDASPASWRAQACRVAGRNLTREEWTRYLGDEPYRATCSELPVPEPAVEASATPGPTPSTPVEPSASPGSPRLCEAPERQLCYLGQAGHYSGGAFRPTIGFDLDEGWYLVRDSDSVLSLSAGERRYLSFLRDVTEVYDSDGEPTTIDGTPDAFVEWLRSRRDIEVEAVRDATLAGRPAKEIDLTVADFAVMFRTAGGGGGGWNADPGARWRVRVAALDSETTLMAIVETSAEQFDSFWDGLAGAVVDSLVLEEGSGR